MSELCYTCGKRPRRKYGSYCSRCRNARQKELYKPEAGRNRTLKHRYGITSEDYNEMFAEQEGKCAICGRHQSEFDEALHVDHDHETDDVRGLLCKGCNYGLGNFQDDVMLLIKAIGYLTTNVEK